MADPFKSNWPTKDRRTRPALTDQERAAILATRTVTVCPPVRVVVTFHQQVTQRRF